MILFGSMVRAQSGQNNAAATTSPANIDPVAELLLQKMTGVIGSIDQLRFHVEYLYDVSTESLGYIKHSERSTWQVKGPDKLLLDIEGDEGHRTFWYSGSRFGYYSWDKNQYAAVDITGNIIDVVDSISSVYGVEFPGADVFYPTFAEDAVMTSSTLSYLGQTQADGRDCFHIASSNPGMNWELWISKDLYFLPVKLLIRYTAKQGSPAYEFHYGQYDLNPGLPDEIFNFTVPPAARQIQIKTM